jgi:PAS domain S-box-containing protein
VCKVTGYTREELLTKNWFKVFVPDRSKENVQKAFESLFVSTTHKDYINAIKTKTGGEIEVDWNNTTIIEDDELVGTISIGVEIVPRNKIFNRLKEVKQEYAQHEKELEDKNNFLEDSKRAMLNLLEDSKKLEEELLLEKRSVEKRILERTKELREEQAKLLAAINSVPLGFMVADPKGRGILNNNSLETILGKTEKAWSVEKLDRILKESVSVNTCFETCLKDKKPVEIKEFLFNTKYLSLYIAPIFISPLSEEFIGAIILISDITEAKAVERSKEEFITIASHELRTPLSAIRGNVELLKKYPEGNINSNDYKEIVTDIHESTVRLIELVNDFLKTSKLEQGKMDFTKEVFTIDKVIQDTCKEFQQQINKKGLYLSYQPDEVVSKTEVVADIERVREVLINLIGNSLKFTDKGGINVSVSKEQNFIKVSVSDTGKGIPKQTQSLVFRKFQQTNSNILIRDYSQGSGLGLYISKLIVEGMGGKIQLERSKENIGSTFSFTLPVCTLNQV